jgi:hypothetical protein
VNPSVEQTFNLVFENTHPTIAPDGTFKDVPLGMDPTQWPLDVDFAKTAQEAQSSPLYPGGQFTVYGDFCWAGDKQRAEAYFIPAGTRPNPQQTSSRDPEVAKRAMQQLQAQHMLGTAIAAGDGYVTFNVPDDDKVLEGSGDNMVARVVVYDNKAHRASAVDEKTVLTLKATKKPLSWPLVAGIAGLLVVIVLLVMVLLRGGGGRRRGGGSPPTPAGPAPYGMPPGGGYGAPPPGGGYGAPPPGGGYGAPPPGAYGMHPGADPLATTAAAPRPGAATPRQAFALEGSSSAMPGRGQHVGAPPPPAAPVAPQDPHAAAAAPVVQVRCPACGMSTMATPGQPSVCFSCGQPLPAEFMKVGGPVNGSGSLVAAPNAPDLAASQNPHGPPRSAPGVASAATIRGVAGQFTIRPGSEVRVGRDPALCPIFLGEPRVSGVHATLRFDGGQLMVRDETSNNGTWVFGSRIAPGAWTPVPPGAPVRFGPIEFTVQLEA